MSDQPNEKSEAKPESKPGDVTDLLTTLEKIREIAQGAAPKVADISAQGQIERIAGLADSALSRNQASKPESEGHGG